MVYFYNLYLSRAIEQINDLRGELRSAIMNLFTFVDWIMILPEAAKVEFWQELKVYEEERKMPYITSIEQIGYDRGQVVGYDRGIKEADQRSQEQLLQRERSIALNMLRKNLDLETIAEITGLTIAQLQDLRSQLELQ